MPNSRVRLCCAVALTLGIAPITWLREPFAPENFTQSVQARLLPLPKASLGPFLLTGAWHLTSPNSNFEGFSTLTVSSSGWLVAFSDTGMRLDMPVPGLDRPADGGSASIAPLMPRRGAFKAYRDVEAAALDPSTGTFWLALEGRNVFMRTHQGPVPPSAIASPELADWPPNSGAEAMARLTDRRFLILAEAGGPDHEGRLLPHAPDGLDRALRFRFRAPDGYRPTDAAQLPDGRVLILLRELRWPMPPRFSTRLVLADPAAIRAGGEWRGIVLGGLDDTGLEDNYEGLAIATGAKGGVTVWLMSDDNGAATQRTLLLRLELRLADLPPRHR
jgi:hypothetical protein